MNDFTKEELESMLHCIELLEADYEDTWDDRLYNKIESMIDNYCEHEWENECCGCDPENLMCAKCKRDLWGDFFEQKTS